MEAKTEKEGNGGPCLVSNSPIDIVPTENKKLLHPPLCRKCKDEYYDYIFPDGRIEQLTCGILVENIAAGNMYFACCYFRIAMPPVINADTMNEALIIVKRLKARVGNCETIRVDPHTIRIVGDEDRFGPYTIKEV